MIEFFEGGCRFVRFWHGLVFNISNMFVVNSVFHERYGYFLCLLD